MQKYIGVIKDKRQAAGYENEAYIYREKGRSSNLTYDAVEQLVYNDLKGQVLDAGCGEGNWSRRLLEVGLVDHLISVDLLDYGASQIPGIDFHETNLSLDLLPCSDESLDWIFAIEIIEHLANPRNFMKEAGRCLKNDGKLVITTPCNESLRAKLFFNIKGYFPDFNDSEYYSNGHITPVTETDLKRMAEEIRFSDTKFYYPVSGRIPKTNTRWGSVFPFLRGKLYADTMFAILTK